MNPITGFDDCARAENGQAAVAPPTNVPTNVMKSRRLIAAPEAKDEPS
jgi:hypothetical protein